MHVSVVCGMSVVCLLQHLLHLNVYYAFIFACLSVYYTATLPSASCFHGIFICIRSHRFRNIIENLVNNLINIEYVLQ